jgi:nucleoside-diphosphate-sugar epimerase
MRGKMSVLKGVRVNKVKRDLTSLVHSLQSVSRRTSLGKMSYGLEDWSEISVCNPYGKSKTMSEKAAWDFSRDLPEDEKFELVTILPGLVSGMIYIPGMHSSGSVYANLISGDWKSRT